MTAVSRRDRITRLRRFVSPRVLRAVFHGVTDPANDRTFALLARRGSRSYLESPEPWFADGAAEYIARAMPSRAAVMEWGAGASTVWFDAKGCVVYSVETDAGWAEAVTARASNRSHVALCDASSPGYLAQAERVASADVVVVDAFHRRECIDVVLDSRNKSRPTIVVLDDTQRAEYCSALERLSVESERERHFASVSLTLGVHLTSVFHLGPPRETRVR